MQIGEKTMRDHVWWKHLHWPEYGAELLGTAFLQQEALGLLWSPGSGLTTGSTGLLLPLGLYSL